MSRFARILGLAALALCAVANAAIYKWTDKEGRVHYTDQAPPGIASEEVSEKLRDAVSTYSPGVRKAERIRKPVYEADRQEDSRWTADSVAVTITPVEIELSRANEKQIRDEVQHIYRTYVELLGWKARPQRVVKVRIFGKPESWNTFNKNVDPKFAKRAYFDGNEIVMHGASLNAAALETLRHEVSHAILHMEIGYAPLWIDEGLAEAFHHHGLGSSTMRVSPNRAGLEMVRMLIREGKLKTWTQYFDLPFDQWRAGSASDERMNYRIAATMMSFLLSSRSGMHCLRNVLFQGKKSGFGIERRSFENYCGDLKRLDTEWRGWVQNQ